MILEYNGLGKRIKKRRLELDMKQGTLCELTGISRPTISRIEHEKCSPHDYTIELIAKALEVDPHWLKYGWQ